MSLSREIGSGASQHRNVYDLVQSFIGLLSPDGTLLDANRSSLDFVGASLEDVVGKPFWETPWWRDISNSRDAIRQAVREGASGEATRFEALLSGKNGEVVHVDFSLTPVFGDDGTVVSLVPEARDITAFKEAVIALQASETRMRFACEVAGIGTWDWDLTDDRLHWDDRQFELFDVPRNGGEMLGQRAIATIHPDDHDRIADAIAVTVEDDVPFRQEFRVVHKNGEVRWLVGRGGILSRDDGGKPSSMIGVNYDITERKTVEKRLSQSNQDLEVRVAERTRQLEREMREHKKALEALTHAQRLDSIGQLAGGVAHDFNNLLAVIGGNLELASMRITDDQVNELIQDALEAVEAGASLNHRLLSFARKGSLEPALLDVNKRIENAKHLLERTLDENIILEVTPAHNAWWIFADAGELDSAILNLAVNARDAMPSGGRLSIVTGNQSFDAADIRYISGAQAGEYVQICISDTGSGMTPYILKNAVTPFFTTKEAGRGSGLGLSSVFGFAKQSGGFVMIDSREGEGTTVKIHLPRATRQSNEGMSKSSDNGVPLGRGELVLLVEDDRAVLSVTRKRLMALDYKVIEASTAAEAINLLETSGPVSLIFSDVRMPGELSGYDLAKWAYDNLPGTRVLLTSGYDASESGDQQNSLQQTVKMLPKPYSMHTLAVALRDALELPTHET